MKLTPAVIVGAGSVAGPAAAALLAECRRLGGKEPWLTLIHGLTIDDDGEVRHLPSPGAEPLFTGKALAGLEPGMSPSRLFKVMADQNRAWLGDEVLAQLRHHLHGTDRAKEISRHGHELDPGLKVFILSPVAEPAGGAATMSVLLALSRLHRTGIIPELGQARVIALMPDLFPDRDTEPAWARAHEYFRELQAFALDARLMGEPDRDLEVDLGVTVLSRALGSGLAIPSWESCLLPLAELVTHEVRNLIALRETERALIEGKPAFLGAFGFFRFSYPNQAVDVYLDQLVRHRWFRRFIAGAADEAELGGELSLFGEQTGLARDPEGVITREAQLAQPPPRLPSVPAETVAAALRPSPEQGVDQLFHRLRSAYDQASKGEVAERTGRLAQAQVRVGERVSAAFDELVKKVFARPVEIGGEERLSLAAGPALVRMLLDPAAPAGIAAWEKSRLADRERLLGAVRDREELEAAESQVRDAVRAGETGRRDREAIAEAINNAREKRLNELAALKAELEAKSRPSAPAAPEVTTAAAPPAPGPAAQPAPGKSLVEQLYGSQGPSLTEQLWGRKSEPAPRPAKDAAQEKTDADPAQASRIELLSRPSPEELELESRARSVQAQLDKIERDLPLLENKAAAMRSKLDESRKIFLDEALHHRRLAELERQKLDKVANLEKEAQSILRERAEAVAAAKAQPAAPPPRPAPARGGKGRWVVAAALALAGVVNLFTGIFDPIITPLGLSEPVAAIIIALVFFAAGLAVAVLGGKKPPAAPLPRPAAAPPRPPVDDAPRIAALLDQAARSLDELLALQCQVHQNYQALNLFARLRTHASSTLVGLGEFKTFFESDAPAPGRLAPAESIWEVSLAPGDLGAYLDRRYGQALRDAIREDASPARVWEIYRDFERSAEKPDLESRIAAVRDQVFRREREGITLAERLLERLDDPAFRSFFANLLGGLGVSATVNEETACPSAVHKTNYLALHAPDAVRDRVLAAVEQASGLSLARVPASSPAEMSIFIHWSSFAAFQLALLMKARDAHGRLAGPGADNVFSLLPEPDCRRLPDLYPLIEVLPGETLALRELALVLIALDLIRADWDRRSFVVAFPEDAHAELRSLGEVLEYLASPAGGPTRVYGEKVLAAILSGDERGPETEARVAKALAWIDEACRQYDRRETIFHALEDDDFRVIMSLPEKLIRV